MLQLARVPGAPILIGLISISTCNSVLAIQRKDGGVVRLGMASKLLATELIFFWICKNHIPVGINNSP